MRRWQLRCATRHLRPCQGEAPCLSAEAGSSAQRVHRGWFDRSLTVKQMAALLSPHPPQGTALVRASCSIVC
jgi:hypothetical protein